MRRYVYISDDKVDLVLPQIAKPYRKRISREVGYAWKIISADQTTKVTPEEHRTARVRAVERYLRETETIGTVDEPKSWFADELPLSWGSLDSGGDAGISIPELVWFAGMKTVTRDTLAVGLGGSVANVIGDPPSDGALRGHASYPALREALSRLRLRTGRYVDEAEPDVAARAAGESRELLLHAAGHLAADSRTATVTYEFLARRLVSGTARLPGGGSHPVTVGTPLFVAMVD